MKNLLLLIISITVLELSSCSDKISDPQTADKQNYIVPLSVGNQWKYREISTKKEGSSTIKEEKVYTLTVQSEEMISGIKEYGIHNSLYNENYMRWYNTAEGFWENYFNVDLRSFSAKYPCKNGDAWILDTFTRTDNQGNILGKFFRKMAVISTNVPRTINGSNFNCYHYQLTYNDLETKEPIANSSTDYFYSVNVGLVEQVDINNGVEDFTKELLSYTVK